MIRNRIQAGVENRKEMLAQRKKKTSDVYYRCAFKKNKIFLCAEEKQANHPPFYASLFCSTQTFSLVAASENTGTSSATMG